MAHFAVISTSDLPDGTRGALTRWMIEPAPGTYVGTLTARVRDYLWNAVQTSIDQQHGWAALIYNTDTEQGYALRTHGLGQHHRTVTDYDGLSLITWPIARDNQPSEDNKSASH
ncbi:MULTISPECIES: type I-E CRISPR-associated endoribonuclease Cas2e [unclassified Saccharopolyspora]|uniref:type I-E CRISPR-associated endoribonuclease Cas2e n=1 Tax=unclassified Saccharopolyspora TaxID=2646250 RepID=UPI001CD529C4|nr:MULTISPECIES: type I-E CRISPR-associated endoribonuclease Cas2e [unclassified Saccharopolyspora]MCA1188778.1 type I-E CRISPR-associated endoribonuclease Cas2e [Saccharopolyspora sp. 6T]MCA1283270.1 type I-E CRISPR-associated endoribonuclease Cas2e [Saccharopolyspora sp. 7B]